MENQLRNLAVELYEINALQFGNFLTKSGLLQTVYFDLRVIISHPKLMKSVSSLLWTLSKSSTSASLICGVPYAALPIATLMSVEANIPMVIKRKETEADGNKASIQGHFKKGETCLVIEDVIATGSSILEATRDLMNEGLIVEEAVVVIDREQGGRQMLKSNGIRVKSLYTLPSLMTYLLDSEKLIPAVIVEKIKNYLEQSHADV